jgi:hypothetical protein
VILCGYVSTKYPKRKKMDTGADTYWATIAHYQIRFGPAEVGWMRLWLSGKKERSEGGMDRTGRRTACGSGGRDGRAPFPCAARRPQLAAPMRPLDPWRRASITVRERARDLGMRRWERKRSVARRHPVQRKRHSMNPRSVQMGWDG